MPLAVVFNISNVPLHMIYVYSVYYTSETPQDIYGNSANFNKPLFARWKVEEHEGIDLSSLCHINIEAVKRRDCIQLRVTYYCRASRGKLYGVFLSSPANICIYQLRNLYCDFCSHRQKTYWGLLLSALVPCDPKTLSCSYLLFIKP